MNFLSGTLLSATAFTADGGMTFDVPTGIGADVLPGTKVDAGIRPEHLSLVPFTVGQQGMEATVELAEPMGNEVVLYVKAGMHSLVARIDPQVVKAGETVTLYVQPGKLHLFDAETEESLTEQPAQVAV